MLFALKLERLEYQALYIATDALQLERGRASLAHLPNFYLLAVGVITNRIDPRDDLFQPIIRRFLRDDYVVHVRFFESGGGDAEKPRLLLELFDVVTSGVTHS